MQHEEYELIKPFQCLPDQSTTAETRFFLGAKRPIQKYFVRPSDVRIPISCMITFLPANICVKRMLRRAIGA